MAGSVKKWLCVWANRASRTRLGWRAGAARGVGGRRRRRARPRRAFRELGLDLVDDLRLARREPVHGPLVHVRGPGDLAALVEPDQRTPQREIGAVADQLVQAVLVADQPLDGGLGLRRAAGVRYGEPRPGQLALVHGVDQRAHRLGRRRLRQQRQGLEEHERRQQEQQPVALLVRALDHDLGVRGQLVQDAHGGQAGRAARPEVDVDERQVEPRSLAERLRQAARVADAGQGMRRALDHLRQRELDQDEVVDHEYVHERSSPRGGPACHQGDDFHRASTRVPPPARCSVIDPAVEPVQVVVEDPQAGPDTRRLGGHARAVIGDRDRDPGAPVGGPARRRGRPGAPPARRPPPAARPPSTRW